MNNKQDWILKAKDKARKDFQEYPKSFLNGATNHYSKDVDVYMRLAYADERMDIIMEQRK